MIIVYVKHFLNEDGRAYFEQEWFPKQVEAIIGQQPGFVGIDEHQDANDETCMHITVRFDTEANLNAWIAKPEHDVVALLDPYRTKAWQAARTQNETADPETLEWKTIEPKNAEGETPSVYHKGRVDRVAQLH